MARRDLGVVLRCDRCGRQRLLASQVVLRRTAVRKEERHDAVAWQCPTCGRRDATAVTDVVDIARLEAAGTPVVLALLPREVHERRPAASPITWDDVLFAHESLGDDDHIEGFVAAWTSDPRLHALDDER